MSNWQVTATTIYCEAVAEEVTLMVYRDGAAKCAGQEKYTRPGKEIARQMKQKSRQLKRPLGCDGSNCPRLLQYRDKLLAEEARRGLEATKIE